MEHPLIVTLCAFLMLMVLMSWVGYRLFYRQGRFIRAQIGAPVITGLGELGADAEPESSTLVTFLQQIGNKVPTSEAEVAKLKGILIQAGFRSEHAMPVFYGVRIICTLVMFVLMLAMSGHLPANPAFNMIVLLFGAFVGWLLPKMFLEKKAKRRQETLRLALPDALDLMVVSVEAGLGLDMAIQHVAREMGVSHPELSEELSLVTLEMRAGKRRSDALRNLAERTGEAELGKLVAILIQSDRFGTSMGESLRTHSDYLRTRRRQEAEERAGKVGVKLVFPIFFFILPSMLIVAAGPGILQVFKYLFPLMNSIGK